MTPTPEQRLAELNPPINLPTPAKPVAAYVPTRRSGNLVFVSGQLPLRDGQLIATGPVPSKASEEIATECAKQCCVNALAALKAEIGELSRVRQFVRLGIFVYSDAGWHEQSNVGNGASDLLVAAFGDAGKHSRAAVGCSSLPRGASVEVEMVVEVG